MAKQYVPIKTKLMVCFKVLLIGIISTSLLIPAAAIMDSRGITTTYRRDGALSPLIKTIINGVKIIVAKKTNFDDFYPIQKFRPSFVIK